MHENEDDAQIDIADIDVIAATLNAEAARVIQLAEKRTRSAHTQRPFARFSGGFTADDEPTPEEALAQLQREEELALQMSTEADKVRHSASELQRLAREMRANHTTRRTASR